MAFKKAEKTQQKLRLGLIGPSGSGKTFSALTVAKHMGARIAVIDTEHGSASKYAGDVADFDVCELASFSPGAYIKALAEAAEYDVVIIDSLSHAWVGKDGILDQADAKGGKFNAWKDLTPQHNALIEAMVSHPSHLIATMRSKTEYAVGKDEKTGKSTVERLGTAAIQRDGLEYEMDVVGHMDQSNTLTIVKSRCIALSGKSIRQPGAELAKTLLAWLSSGAPMVIAPATAKPVTVAQTYEEKLAAARAKLASITTRQDYDAFTKLMKAPGTSDQMRMDLSPDWIKKGAELTPESVTTGDAAQ
jgi:hypothetical protein